MVTKKAESFTKKTAGELVVGDRFRTSPDDEVVQQVVSFDKAETDLLEEDQVTKKEMISCETKIDGSTEKFRFTAFTQVEVEVLNG